MSVPGKLPPSPFQLHAIPTDRLAATEYNAWPQGTHGLDARTAKRASDLRQETLSASQRLDRSTEGSGPDATKMEDYSHWRAHGDVFSESVPGAQAEQAAAGKTTTPSKVGLGTLPVGPALGYSSKFHYRE